MEGGEDGQRSRACMCMLVLGWRGEVGRLIVLLVRAEEQLDALLCNPW